MGCHHASALVRGHVHAQYKYSVLRIPRICHLFEVIRLFLTEIIAKEPSHPLVIH